MWAYVLGVAAIVAVTVFVTIFVMWLVACNLWSRGGR